jgi:hypothetical protein
MNASKLLTVVASFALAASAFAADLPVAQTSAAVAAAAQSVPAVAATKAVPTREKVRAEAIDANNDRRASEAGSTDWFMK